jgi:hypothetical protein
MIGDINLKNADIVMDLELSKFVGIVKKGDIAIVGIVGVNSTIEMVVFV